jgi:CheY-like chemotaxis protein
MLQLQPQAMNTNSKMNSKNFVGASAQYQTPLRCSPDSLTESSQPSRTGLPKRILIADDEPLIRQLCTKVLVEADYKVEGAEDGAVAWDALQVNVYDLLITDNQMPKMSGVDLLKMIYTARMTLPIMMATATFPEEEFNRSP